MAFKRLRPKRIVKAGKSPTHISRVDIAKGKDDVVLATIRLPLDEVVSGGWKALEATTAVTSEKANDPTLPSIVLVSFGKVERVVKGVNREPMVGDKIMKGVKGGFETKVRLDIGKGMFLDSTPAGVSPEDGRRLADSVAAKWTKGSGDAR